MKRLFTAQCGVLALWAIPLFGDEESKDLEPAGAEEIEELIVSARATIAVDRMAALPATIVDADAIDAIQAIHPHEIMTQVPGVWISRGSGQEHLTAIRSGVLTGAGACGAYLLLENGIPIRPPSLCNVNGLFELNTEQARAIEVIRGPASSRYGGNALHGVINAITMGSETPNSVGWQLGSHSYSRMDAYWNTDQARMTVHATTTDGWRDSTGFNQQKLNGQVQSQLGKWLGAHNLSVTLLNQETGGYVVGLNAYQDDALRTTNPNPEAFRDARSFRYASHWRNGNVMVAPYARRSSMEFLMHFLPGQPIERNMQSSAGVLLSWEREWASWATSLGLQLETVRAGLSEVQSMPTIGSAFLVATRPMGTHYDFEVDATHAGFFNDGRMQATESFAWQYRFRIESTTYGYDNLHFDGNTRDDGTVCGFGGCLYTRPADREDQFADYAMQIGFEQSLGNRTILHGMLGTGFRPPQITELYRLQNGQHFADIDSERLDALEVGLNHESSRATVQLAAYVERSRHLIIRDAEGLNQSNGRVNSRGIEMRLGIALSARHEIRLTQSWARHRYGFTQNLARREKIVAGNIVDTAPTHLGSLQWHWRASSTLRTTLEGSRIGSYFMDAANTLKYPGHVVLHWHTKWRFARAWELQGHIRNLLDKKYADRADWSFGNPRYFPAMPRNLQLGIKFYF